jgi:hypothetical protein
VTDATEATVSAKGLAVVGAMIGSLAGYAVPTSSLIFSIGIISFVGLLGGTVGHVTEYWLIKNRLLSSGGQSGDGSSSEPEDISGDMIAADQSDLLPVNELVKRVTEEEEVQAVDRLLDKGVFYQPASGTDPIILASTDTYLHYQEKITKLEDTKRMAIEELDSEDA